MGTTSLEREIKLRFQSPAEAREAVIGIGATPLRGRRLQEDCLLDTDDERLRAARSRAARPDGARAAASSPTRGRCSPSPWKLREERETIVSRRGDDPLHPRAAGLLGLVPLPEVPRGVRRLRRHHRARRDADRHVRRDRGQREGDHRDWPPRSAAPKRDYIVDSYRRLYVQHCEAQAGSRSGTWCSTSRESESVHVSRPAPDRRPRHAAPAAVVRPRQAGAAGGRRGARPPDPGLARGERRHRRRAEPPPPARDGLRGGRRRVRPRRACPLLVGEPRSRLGGRPAPRAAAARRATASSS